MRHRPVCGSSGEVEEVADVGDDRLMDDVEARDVERDQQDRGDRSGKSNGASRRNSRFSARDR
jgi:hypothetical protein